MRWIGIIHVIDFVLVASASKSVGHYDGSAFGQHPDILSMVRKTFCGVLGYFVGNEC